MGNLLRILGPTHLGLTLALAATSEADGFPVSNLETGNRQRFWQATSPADQFLTYDAGVGFTKTCDTVVLPRADLLVAVDADVVVQWSTDMSAWTDAFTPETPIASNDLLAPGLTDYLKEFTTQTKRGWRVKIYGTPTAAASLAGGLFLGTRYEVAKNPLYGHGLGLSGPTRGQPLGVQWGKLLEAQASPLRTVLEVICPDDAEGPLETAEGVVYGGLPHYLHDPIGAVFNQQTAGTPWLWPAMCVTPRSVVRFTSVAKGVLQGPSLEWRERR